MNLAPRFFLSVCMMACVSLAACVAVNETAVLPKKDYRSLDTLTSINDLNESVFKYVTYCEKAHAKPDPGFVKNYEYVLNRLLDEKIKVEGYGVKQASRDIMKRRQALQDYLDRSFQQEGCDSALSSKAAQHYRFFKDFTPAKIDRLIHEGMATPFPAKS